MQSHTEAGAYKANHPQGDWPVNFWTANPQGSFFKE